MNPDFVALLRELTAADARFMVVGAYALAHHARPRATGDLDIWVDPAPENAKRVHAALLVFGAPLGDLTVEELSQPDLVYQIGVVPRRIDILTTLTGLDFADAWPGHSVGTFGSMACPVLGRAELILNKRSLGRPRDLADLESLGE